MGKMHSISDVAMMPVAQERNIVCLSGFEHRFVWHTHMKRGLLLNEK